MPRRLRRLRFISQKLFPILHPLPQQATVLELIAECIKAWPPEILLRDVARHGRRAQAYTKVLAAAAPSKKTAHRSPVSGRVEAQVVGVDADRRLAVDEFEQLFAGHGETPALGQAAAFRIQDQVVDILAQR